MSNHTTVPPPVPSFPCPIGLQNSPISGTSLWVRSPRTGTTVHVNKHLWTKLGRLADRIVHAVSQGQRTLDLTTAELRAIATAKQNLLTDAQRSAAASLDRRLSFRRSRGFVRGH
jgi:hypothetical protein